MKNRTLLTLVLSLVSAVAGCNAVLGDLSTRLATDDTDPTVDGGPGSSSSSSNGTKDGGGCVVDDVKFCEGKCGTLLNTCGVTTTCGGCDTGTCGGGGPNVCGAGTCVPACNGKACGASDGCSGICNAGCACGPTNCAGCCAENGTCQLGTSNNLCGGGGVTCNTCGTGGDCTAVGNCITSTTSGLLMFGGGDSTNVLNAATWEFDGTSWTQRTVTGSVPAARSGHATATYNQGVLLFGGSDATGTELADTWLFSGGTWSEVATTGPGARDAMGMANLGGAVYLFGGEIEDPTTGTVTTLYNDTWKWSGAGWAHVTTATSPPARSAFGMATLNNKIYLFGGYTQSVAAVGGTPVQSNLNDTWSFDGTNWTQVTTATAPSQRNSFTLAALATKIVLFSGYTGSGSTLPDDTWTFDGATWTQLSVTSPTARGGYSTATLNGSLIVSGGTDGTNVLEDTWSWNGATWTAQSLSSEVPGLLGASMAHVGP